MPKEIIRGVAEPWHLDADGEVVESPDRPQVEVRWTGPEGGGMHVQLVSKVVDLHGEDLPRERVRFPKAEAARAQIVAHETRKTRPPNPGEYVDPQPVAVDTGLSDEPDYKAILEDVLAEIETGGMCSPRAAIPCTEGYYVTLDRQGLNDLIRTARRVRDKSFGKDQ